jgi:hypothetical protein
LSRGGATADLQRADPALNTILTMARRLAARASLLLTFAVGTMVALSGCGGGTKTVSAASSPTVAQTTQSATSSTGPTGTSQSTTTNQAPTTTASGGTSTPSGTRTAPAPAFTEREKSAGGNSGANNGSEGLAAAEATVRAQGYTVDDQGDYHQDQTLRVLIGTGEHSNDGYDKRAFFFVDGRYIGTDSTQPSAQLSVTSQSDTEVVLAYQLYKPGNPLCCPAGGQAKVRFQLNDGQLTPLDPIPPVNSSTGTSRQ